MITQIKVVSGDDEFLFDTNAVIFLKGPSHQVQITINPDGEANIVSFEPHQGSLYVEVDGADCNYFSRQVVVSH